MNTQTPTDAHALDVLLEFYTAAGVDCALSDDPVDRFVESAQADALRAQQAQNARSAPPRDSQRIDPRRPAPQSVQAPQSLQRPAAPAQKPVASSGPATPPPAADKVVGQAAGPASGPVTGNEPTLHHLPDQPSRNFASLHGDEAVAAARALAAGAETLAALREAVAKFEGCGLRTTAKSLVFADGNPAAKVMFIGGAPEREEDIAGTPFVGASGQLLDKMLAAIGLDRASVYLANTVPWRPPGGRDPTPQEADICKPFILRQIALCDPDVVVCLGGVSSKALLGMQGGILKERGAWREFQTGKRAIKAIATLHPSFLLKNAAQKRSAWYDLLAIKAALTETAPRA